MYLRSKYGGSLHLNPNLGPLIGTPGYYPLSDSSPAIDAGNPAGCTGSTGILNIDQRGAPRVGTCDIGSYEYKIPGVATKIVVLSGTLQHTAPLTNFANPLKALVLDNSGSPVNGVTVTFTAPSNGASGTFVDSNAVATTSISDAFGVATSTFKANEIQGSYMVSAAASEIATPSYFSLTNIAWYVATTGSNSNDCRSSNTPCRTINAAIYKATGGDTIKVATGTYTGTGTEVVLINKNITLSGGWNAAFTIQSSMSTIDGQSARIGVSVNQEISAMIERFVVQNGLADYNGGGIYNGGTLILTNSLVQNNTCCSNGTGGSSNGGGGIGNFGALTVNNSTITGNRAYFEGGSDFQGGGLFNYRWNVNTQQQYHQRQCGTLVVGYSVSARWCMNNSTVTGIGLRIWWWISLQ